MNKNKDLKGLESAILQELKEHLAKKSPILIKQVIECSDATKSENQGVENARRLIYEWTYLTMKKALSFYNEGLAKELESLRGGAMNEIYKELYRYEKIREIKFRARHENLENLKELIKDGKENHYYDENLAQELENIVNEAQKERSVACE